LPVPDIPIIRLDAAPEKPVTPFPVIVTVIGEDCPEFSEPVGGPVVVV
jgi:hypothetical protein